MKKKLLIFLFGISALVEAHTQTIGIGSYYRILYIILKIKSMYYL